MEERIPIELCDLIREKPEITYLMLKMTTRYLFLSASNKDLGDDEIDQVIWNYINSMEAGEMKLEETKYKPEELN